MHANSRGHSFTRVFLCICIHSVSPVDACTLADALFYSCFPVYFHTFCFSRVPPSYNPPTPCVYKPYVNLVTTISARPLWCISVPRPQSGPRKPPEYSFGAFRDPARKVGLGSLQKAVLVPCVYDCNRTYCRGTLERQNVCKYLGKPR